MSVTRLEAGRKSDNGLTSPKKVLYVSHSAQLYGAERCLLQLLSQLDQKRFHPIVVLPGDGPLVRELEQMSIPFVVIPSMRAWLSRKNRLWMFFLSIGILPFLTLSVTRLVRLIHEHSIDLIHSNSLVILDGAIAARLTGRPHVWHARELLAPETFHKFLFGPRAAVSIIRRLTDYIIAISKVTYESLVSQMRDAHGVHIMYDGVPMTSQPSSEAILEARRALGIPVDARLVGQIAQLSPAKGVEDFLLAASIVRDRIPQVVFLVVGGESQRHPHYRQHLDDLIRRYSLEGHVRLTGFREDVSDILAALDVLVLASHYEPFGRVLLEGMAFGKAIVAARTGGIPEIVEDGVTGFLVPPGDSQAIAQSILKILDDPTLARAMGQAGRVRVEQHFGLDQYVQVECLYETMLNTPISIGQV